MEKLHNYVYITKNLINEKCYVGDHSTNNIEKDNYLGSGLLFVKAINKYGKENFKKEIIEFFPTKLEAFNAQKKYIDQFNSIAPYGYNISPTGGHGVIGCCSDDTKEKLGKIWKGRKHSQETKDKISKSKREHAVIYTDEIRLKMSEAQKGKKASKETKEKMSTSHVGLGKGRVVSEDTKIKLSIARKTRSSGMKGKKMSDEAKEKISNIHKGKKLSDETKKKISENNGMKNKGYLVTGDKNGMRIKKLKSLE